MWNVECVGISDFAFVSDFGFRTSGFRPVTRHSTHVTYLAYAPSASRKNNVLSTSLRSDAQATDSTCSGCQANKAAATALRHRAPVSRVNNRKSSRLFAA